MIDLNKDILEFLDNVPTLARVEGIRSSREWGIVNDALRYGDGDMADWLISSGVMGLPHVENISQVEIDDTIRRCLHVFWIFYNEQPLT